MIEILSIITIMLPLIQPVSLAWWSFIPGPSFDNYPDIDCSVFHCRSFEDQVKHLDKHPLQLPPPPATDKSLMDAWKNNAYIKNGFCILPHKAINGAKSISWYRGPVSKNRVPISKSENYNTSDNWVQKQNDEADVVDVSYSAAWELGRLLALENTGFSSDTNTLFTNSRVSCINNPYQ